jgi:soluble lytic murein transglycosylase-like protein
VRRWLALAFVLGVGQAQTPQEQAAEKQRAGIEIQKQSVRRQVKSAASTHGFFAAPWSNELQARAEPLCDPVHTAELDRMITDASQKNALTPDLLRAVVQRESAGRPCAVSSAGAMGLMQIMPQTANYLGLMEPFDPAKNIEAGSRYLRELLDRYGGDLVMALAAYNAGPRKVDEAGGIPPIRETQDYVRGITKQVR